MDYSTEVSPDGKILIATVVGELDEASYLLMRNKVFNSLKSTNAQHILLDIRHGIVRASIAEVFNMATSNIEMIPRGSKYAIVYSEKSIPEKDAKFGETVARNRGGQFRIFKDISEAKKWLAISGVESE